MVIFLNTISKSGKITDSEAQFQPYRSRPVFLYAGASDFGTRVFIARNPRRQNRKAVSLWQRRRPNGTIHFSPKKKP
ncbi:MAG: hypothetical protein D6714_14620 [Bacteroidetes bacterium]|nr:MAG: hypothetical protein D6714_14620 [Bacteroidota bacterium]